MESVILGAKGKRDFTLKGRTQTTLDWILPALTSNGISKIFFVGGEEIDKNSVSLETVKMIYNPEWSRSGMLTTLSCAIHNVDTACIITYSDIIFKPSLIKTLKKSLVEKNANFILAVDSEWRERSKNKDLESILKAEKVIVQNTNVKDVRKGEVDPSEVHSEFCGVLCCSEEGTQIIQSLCNPEKFQIGSFHGNVKFKDANIIHLIQKIIGRGNSVIFEDLRGDWAELENNKDFLKFIFKNKSDTLRALEGEFTKSIILPQFSFNISEWSHSKKNILNKIKLSLQAPTLVVRSSSSLEDSVFSSSAGKFDSVLQVEKSDRELTSAINKVIKSYGIIDETIVHKVLIQPFLEDVVMSGVIFSCELKNGSPYLTLEFEKNGSTSGITSGSSIDGQTLFIKRDSDLNRIEDHAIKAITEAFLEIETKLNVGFLDCEFAILPSGEVVIFQIRPLTITNSISRFLELDSDDIFKSSVRYVEQLLADDYLPGDSNILSDMSDWNPVEMIGTHPKPLARSLYQYLITNHTWRKAREEIGYRKNSGTRLMEVISGHPYINLKASFNSYLPKGLTEKLENKIINYYLKKLKSNPHFYDKVEFEILITCISPLSKKRIEAMAIELNLDHTEVQLFKESLLTLTNNIFNNKEISIQSQYEKTDTLRDLNIEIFKSRNISTLVKITKLLDICIEYGTLPFSILARYGFIASTYLNEFVKLDIITKNEYREFLINTNTISTKLLEDLAKTQNKSKSIDCFLKTYGHLRPGTYDLLSERYDENPEKYFSFEPQSTSSSHSSSTKNHFNFSEESLERIKNYLSEEGIQMTPKDLICFLKDAIKGREEAKFIFSKCLSDALLLITRFGIENGISANDLTFINIDDLINLSLTNQGVLSIDLLHSIIQMKKNQFDLEKQVILPSIIHEVDNLYYVKSFQCKPTFITNKVITSSVFNLSQETQEGDIDLSHLILCIENADPGFDWIFSKGIKGLITCYGGAASHMAIRCAELSIPAAIGCGNIKFNKILDYDKVILNCENESITELLCGLD